MTECAADALDLPHLAPAAQAIALLPDADRVAHIRAERWIGYTRAKQALANLEDLFHWPQRQRMQNMLLIGPTNNGKSMIIERFRREHLPTATQDAGTREIIPVVIMQMPAEPSLVRFYNMLMHAMHMPFLRRQRVTELEFVALRTMRVAKVQMLIIDELHNMLAGGQAVRATFLNVLRLLGNQLRIPIVGVGTGDAYRAISSDDQLENRFCPFTLPRWKAGDEFSSLLASFAASFPLRRRSDLYSSEMASYILTRTEGTIGEVATLLSRAAIAAIETKEEAINARALALADYDSPTERRRACEREIA